MPRKKSDAPSRQIYASIREDVYLAAKARAAELRMPLRQFIEMALELVVAAQDAPDQTPTVGSSIWEDEYLGMQANQPLGTPMEFTRDEAEKIVKATFGASPNGG
jgi:hypothetical protein